jgi:hypothetical protein
MCFLCSSTLAISSSVMLAVTFVRQAWYCRDKRIWNLGVKELAHGSTGPSCSIVSMFGNIRAPEDQILQTWALLLAPIVSVLAPIGSALMEAPSTLRTMLKLSIIRRTSCVKCYSDNLNSQVFSNRQVESLAFAVWRVTAVVLVSILVARSVQLFHGVIYEKFGVQETWDAINDIGNQEILLYHVGSNVFQLQYCYPDFIGLTR